MGARLELADLSAEELADLRRVLAGEITLTAYRETWSRAHPPTRRLLAELEESYTPDPPQNPSTFEEVLNRVDLSSDLWLGMERAQQEIAKLRHTDPEVSVTINDDKPVLVVFLSDLHIGHTEANMRKIRQDCETIANTDGMYVIFGGDMVDNVNTAVAARGMHHEQLTPTDVQKELIEQLAEFLGPEKILAMLLGNHDEWSMKNDGFNPVRYLANHVGAPYLGPFGFINVAHGKQRYRILAAHQFRMNSSFNKTHAPKRLMDFIGDADVVFTGHKHDPAAEQVYVRQGKRFYAQAGSYLRTSVYGNRLGFTPSTSEMPGVLLWPDRFKFDGSFDAIGDVWKLQAARHGA